MDEQFLPDRRQVLLALGAFALAPGTGAAAAPGSWDLAVQILAGTRVKDPTVLALALQGLTAEIGVSRVDALLRAILSRDADSIVEPFSDSKIEAAARRLVDIVYSGEIPTGPDGAVTALAFHQALAWQVLPFTKPPSVCGPGFGWWSNPPDIG
jgi:hypothetical protein